MFSIALAALLCIDFTLLFVGNVIFYYRVFKDGHYARYIAKIKSAFIESKIVEKDNNENNHPVVNIVKKRTFFQSILNFTRRSFLFVFKWIGIILLIVVILAIIAIFLGIPTASIWGTVLVAINYGIFYGVLFLFAMKLVNFLFGLWVYKWAKIDKNVTKRVLVMDAIQFTMLAILVFLAAFGFPVNVNNLIMIPFKWDVVLNNFLAIVIPMLFFALVITNVFALFIRLRNILTKDINRHLVIRLHQLLFIFIASCFFGILYITDIDYGFMSEVERDLFLETLEVVKWIVTSVFIPVFIYTLNNFKRVKTPIFRPIRRSSGRM